MRLEDLQQRRRKAVGTAVVSAMHSLRAQSKSLAQALRQWSRSTKAINAALKRYETATADVDNLAPPSRIEPTDFARCLRSCVDEQRSPLSDTLSELALQRVYIERAGKRSAKRKAKRAAKRARAAKGRLRA